MAKRLLVVGATRSVDLRALISQFSEFGYAVDSSTHLRGGQSCVCDKVYFGIILHPKIARSTDDDSPSYESGADFVRYSQNSKKNGRTKIICFSRGIQTAPKFPAAFKAFQPPLVQWIFRDENPEIRQMAVDILLKLDGSPRQEVEKKWKLPGSKGCIVFKTEEDIAGGNICVNEVYFQASADKGGQVELFRSERMLRYWLFASTMQVRRKKMSSQFLGDEVNRLTGETHRTRDDRDVGSNVSRLNIALQSSVDFPLHLTKARGGMLEWTPLPRRGSPRPATKRRKK